MNHATRWLITTLLSASLIGPLAGLAKPVQLKGAVYSPQAGVIWEVSKYDDKIDAAPTKALFGK